MAVVVIVVAVLRRPKIAPRILSAQGKSVDSVQPVTFIDLYQGAAATAAALHSCFSIINL